MYRSIVLALMASGVLSACSGKIVGPPPQPGYTAAYSDSIGFTGVGSEPF
ncbi:MAG: hypothetical protein WBB25_12220 [Sulfitobacter sp.]